MLDKSPILRVFFGIPISNDKVQAFRKRLLKENPHLKNQVRWTCPENHHITLRFLGNIAEQKTPTLIEPITEAIADMPPFQVTLRNITAFPPDHPKMGSINIQPSVELQSLYNAIDLVVTTLDFPPENRPYLPHITLFRLRNKQKFQFNKILLGNQTLNVSSFILYQSVPIEKGTLYVPLHKFSL